MKIRLATAAAAAIAAPILLPATHALAATANVSSPVSATHVSGGCGDGCDNGFFGGHRDGFHEFPPVVVVHPIVVVKPFFIDPCFHPCFGDGI